MAPGRTVRSRRGPIVAGLCAVSAAAFAVRVLNWRRVFTGGGVRFVAPDAMYHMRRVFNAVHARLAVPDYDPYMNFPRGFHSNLPPLFDQVIAAIALALGRGHPSPHLVEVVGALLPPLLGAMTVVVVFFIARAYMDDWFAVLSAAVFALLPFHIQVSVLGRPDHHVAIVFFSSVLFLIVARLSGRESPPVAAVLSVLGGLALFVNLMMWGGSLLFAAILFAHFAVIVLVNSRRPEVLRRLTASACCLFLSAAVLLLPVALRISPGGAAMVTWGAMTRLHVLLLACCAAVLLALKLLAEAHALRRAGRRSSPRAVAALVMLVLLAAIVASTARGPFTGLLEAGTRWLIKDDALQRYVVEGRRLSMGAAVEDFTGLLFLFPLALGLMSRRSWRGGRPERGSLICAWSLLAGAAAVMQERFADLFSVPAALMAAYLISAAFHALFSAGRPAGRGVTWRRLGRRRAALACACLCLLCLAAWPPVKWHLFYWRSARARHVSLDAVYDVCRWLRENTPGSPGYQDASGRPGYSVLAGWDLGHAIVYIAQRANVANNLIAWEQNREENLKPYRFFATDDAAEAERILDSCGARYIIVDEMVSSGNFARMLDILGMNHDEFFTGAGGATGERHYTTTKRALDSMVMRLYLYDGEGLDRFKLVHESEARRPAAGRRIAMYKVFEYLGQ